ncbi:hypothetical protein Q427_12370 [Halomonas sp. BC04]|nr:hypothetical protein Q427_12370 [Halomonas sp. BC04]
MDSASGLPCSSVISRASASWLAMMASNQARSRAARCLAVFLRQAGQAASAAATASLAASASRSATWASTAPVAGLVTAKRLGPSRHCPAI